MTVIQITTEQNLISKHIDIAFFLSRTVRADLNIKYICTYVFLNSVLSQGWKICLKKYGFSDIFPYRCITNVYARREFESFDAFKKITLWDNKKLPPVTWVCLFACICLIDRAKRMILVMVLTKYLFPLSTKG